MRYGSVMRCGTRLFAIGCGLLGFAGHAAIAEDAASPSAPANTYIVITNRNAFGIKPPPEPPPPAPVMPATPPPNLFLTGLSFLNGSKRAYLVVNKTGAKQPEYLSVEEGYDSDGLQVLDIDPRKQVVRVRNAGAEVTLNFKDNGLKGNAVPVAPPGMPNGGPMRGVPPPPGYAPQPAAQPVATAAPTIIGRGGAAAENAAAAPPQAVALDAAGGATEAPARQLPARRGVYLGGSTGTTPQQSLDTGATPTGTPAPSRPGTVNGPLRPGTPIPPIPGQ